MRQNNKPRARTSQQIQIKLRYYQLFQILDLQRSQEWLDVIMHRDWTQLKRLQMCQCEIDADDLQVFPDLQFPNLRILNLSHNRLGSTGAKLLSKIDLPALGSLYLSKCNFEGQSLKHLMKGKWPQLTFLRLYSNAIGLDGHHNLTKCCSSIMTDMSIHAYIPIGILQLAAATKWSSSKDNGLYCEIRYIGNIKNNNIKEHLLAIVGQLYKQ